MNDSSITTNTKSAKSTSTTTISNKKRSYRKKSTPKKQKRKTASNKNSVVRRGRWALEEKKAFLRGFRLYGKGKWKAIAKLIPERTTVQVKTHAQMVLKKMESGEKVFSILDEDEQEQHPSIDAEEVDADDDDADVDADDSTKQSEETASFEEDYEEDEEDEEDEYSSLDLTESSNELDTAAAVTTVTTTTIASSPSYWMKPIRPSESMATPPLPLPDLDPSSKLPLTKHTKRSHQTKSPLRVNDYIDSTPSPTGIDLNDKDCDVKSAAHILLELSTSPIASTEFKLSPRPEPVYDMYPQLLTTTMTSPARRTFAHAPSTSSLTSPPPIESPFSSSNSHSMNNDFSAALVSLHPRRNYQLDYSMAAV